MAAETRETPATLCHRCTHTPMTQHQEQLGVKYLMQEYFIMETGPINVFWGERFCSYGQGLVGTNARSYCKLVNKAAAEVICMNAAELDNISSFKETQRTTVSFFLMIGLIWLACIEFNKKTNKNISVTFQEFVLNFSDGHWNTFTCYFIWYTSSTAR